MVWRGDSDRPQRGKVVVTVSGDSFGTPEGVTFDPPFSAAPIVTVQAIGTSAYFATTTGAPTASGMSVSVRQYENVTPGAPVDITVHWTAAMP